MKHIRKINEFFGGDGTDANYTDDYTDEQLHFINYLNDYRFVTTIKTMVEVPSKFLGITYKKDRKNAEKEIVYNDFSTAGKEGDAVLVESGRNGAFRPEGYMYGSATLMNEKVKNRLKVIVDSYNKLHDKQLKLSESDKHYLVSGF